MSMVPSSLPTRTAPIVSVPPSAITRDPQHSQPLQPEDQVSLEEGIYRQRNRVERFFDKLKQFRRVATRYEGSAPILRLVSSPPCGFGCDQLSPRPSPPMATFNEPMRFMCGRHGPRAKPTVLEIPQTISLLPHPTMKSLLLHRLQHTRIRRRAYARNQFEATPTPLGQQATLGASRERPAPSIWLVRDYLTPAVILLIYP